MTRLRLDLRDRLLLLTLLAATVFVAALTVGFNVVLRAQLHHDANDLLRQRAVAHLTGLSVTDGRLRVSEIPDEAAGDVPIWVYAGRRALERPLAAPRNQRAADSLAAGPHRFADVGPTDTRLYTLPVARGGRRVGTVVSAISLAPYERTAHTALVASAVFGLLLLVLVMLVVRWMVGAALRPVARMTGEVADWSERDLDHRFSLGEPHDELTRLAATFDRLLDRLAGSLRREQRFSAELSHELRTPLSKLIAEAELALRRERTPDAYRRTLELVLGAAQQMSKTLEALLAAARAELPGRAERSDAREAADRAAAACATGAAERGVAVEVTGDSRARVDGDADMVERIIAPLVENGCRYAAGRVRIDVARRDGEVRVTVLDDGPGVREAERERIFEPGFRAAGGDGRSHPGAGLGLALARRLARALRGDVECVTDPGGGRFEVRLPAA